MPAGSLFVPFLRLMASFLDLLPLFRAFFGYAIMTLSLACRDPAVN